MCTFGPSLLRRCIQIRTAWSCKYSEKIEPGADAVASIFKKMQLRAVAVAPLHRNYNSLSRRRCCKVLKKGAASRRRCCAVALKRYSFVPSLLRRCTGKSIPRSCGCIYYLLNVSAVPWCRCCNVFKGAASRRRCCAVASKLQQLVASSLLQRFKKRCSFAPSLLRRWTKKVQLRGVAVAPLHQKISHLGQVVVYTIYSTFHCRVVAVAMFF